MPLRDKQGQFVKGYSHPKKGITKRVNTCVYCGKQFVRKTLIHNGVNKGKYAYSIVKYCDEHKNLRPHCEMNSFRKGHIPWNKGKKTGKSSWNKGKKMSDVAKAKLSASLIGRTPWNKGKEMTPELRLKLSVAQKKAQKARWDKLIANGYQLTTPANRLERIKFSQDVRKKVLERDNYTCQLCRERGGKLQVDHIQPWAEYVDLRFDINNCRTLCMSCHYKITFKRSMPQNIKSWGHNLLLS